jgi:hypothetical protein
MNMYIKRRSCRPQVDHLTKFVMGDGAEPDADEQAQEQRRGNRRDTWAPGVMGAPHGGSWLHAAVTSELCRDLKLINPACRPSTPQWHLATECSDSLQAAAASSAGSERCPRQSCCKATCLTASKTSPAVANPRLPMSAQRARRLRSAGAAQVPYKPTPVCSIATVDSWIGPGFSRRHDLMVAMKCECRCHGVCGQGEHRAGRFD